MNMIAYLNLEMIEAQVCKPTLSSFVNSEAFIYWSSDLKVQVVIQVLLFNRTKCNTWYLKKYFFKRV